MAVINHSKREINAKLVYFGPAGAGKEAAFRFIHQRIKPSLCGQLKSMPSGSDTLLFFDYIPFETSSIDGYRVKIHLYTLTGEVTNPGTWKMVLKGVDGVVLVARSGEDGMAELVSTARSLRTILYGYGKELRSLPRFLLTPDALQGSADDELYADFGADRVAELDFATGNGLISSLASLSQEILQRLKIEFAAAQESVVSVSPSDEVPDDMEPLTVSVGGETGGLVPELQIKPGDVNNLCIPITIRAGATDKQYLLKLSVQLEELS